MDVSPPQNPQATTVIVGAGVAGLTATVSLLLDSSYTGKIVLIDNTIDTNNNSQKASSGINFPTIPNPNNIKDEEDDRKTFIRDTCVSGHELNDISLGTLLMITVIVPQFPSYSYLSFF